MRFIDSEFLTHQDVAKKKVAGCHAILVTGGFGERGIEGKIAAIQYARESFSFFGICLGIQLAVVEFARNVLNIVDAHSEFAPDGDNCCHRIDG